LKDGGRTEVPFRSLLSAQRVSDSVPPLRERVDDIPLLVRHFVQQFGRRMGKTIETIPSETMDALVRTTGRATFVNFKTSSNAQSS